MDLGNFEHWGVVVRPGETMNCDPGEIYCHISQVALQASKGNEDVRVFVKVAGQEILLGTLSVDRYPQHTTDLVFDKEFELLHTSKTSNISVIGYKFSGLEKRSGTSTVGDDDSDDEVPLAIPLYSNADDDKSKETKGGEDKAARPGATATQSSKPKATLEETKNTGNLKADVGGNDEDDSEESESDDNEDSSDEDDSENSDRDDDETDFPEKAKAKNKPAETPLKTPPVKKAKVETPSKDHKTGSGTAKRSSGHIHVATPYPSKHVKKAPSDRRKL